MISVIVPVFNTEKYLHKCLNSIVSQTYKDLEIIVVDDGSFDNSPRICDEFAQKDNRIKVVHKNNEGVSVARNTAIDMASGEYLFFVDSDDYMAHNMIEVLYKDLNKNNADISMCDFRTEGEFEDFDYNKNNSVNMNSDIALKHLYIDADFNFVILWAKLFKKSLFDNIRLLANINMRWR